MKRPSIDLSDKKVADFCKRNHIRKLTVFGSFLREDFGADSDIDLLVEFSSDHIPCFILLKNAPFCPISASGSNDNPQNT
jgi:predicted nucleotidyltransferase